MKQVKCVITDDEPTACEGLQRYVEKVDFLSLMGVCEDTMQLNTLLQTEQPDLLFLDIEMPYLSGLELLASLAHPPHVIITSAYEQYALKGYELDVTDYLLKPISFDRFLKAVNKVHGLLQQEKWPDEANNFIFVRSDRQMHKVLFKDILVVEGLENYVCIYTESTKLLVRSTMKRMIEALPGGVFQQVHKSYLINLEKIEMIDGNRIIVGRHNRYFITFYPTHDGRVFFAAMLQHCRYAHCRPMHWCRGVGGGRFGIHTDGFPYIRFAGTGDGQWHCVLFTLWCRKPCSTAS